MALQASQSISAGAFTTPAPITAALTDTVAGSSFGQQGVAVRVITSGTTTNVSVSDPGVTPSGNPADVTPLAMPATGVRMLLIPLSAINRTTGVATLTFSSITGVTYELYRY